MASTVLSIKNATKVFGQRVAVNNLSLSLKEGEIFGFLGPNGAGKTTTMRMICGLAKPTRGEIFICGHNVRKKFQKAISNIGGIIEMPLMYGYMSGYDNLMYYARLVKGIKKERVLECAKIVGLEHRIKDKVSKYSLGMRQRLGIAQALLHSPKLLVLDEPLSGLDPSGVKEMRDFLISLSRKQNIAIMISSHMLGEMEQLCDTLGVISNGELIEVKTINQLKEGIEGSRKIRFKVDTPNFAGKIIINEFKYRAEIAGNSVLVYAGEEKISEIAKKLINYGISIFGVEVISKSLEEVFLDIIKLKGGNTSIL